MNERVAAIREVADRVERRSETPRDWFRGWRWEFDAAAEGGDEEACELLDDILFSFDAWQRSNRGLPKRLRLQLYHDSPYRIAEAATRAEGPCSSTSGSFP